MSGIYENLPNIYHGVARFFCPTSSGELQRILLQTLCNLNQNWEGLEFPEFSSYDIEVGLEVGIADGLTFTHVDGKTVEGYLERAREQPFPALDFLCIVRYYVVEKESRRPLRFDYFMLRFLFGEKNVELRVYHEKGTRRLSVEDLIRFLSEQINLELAREKAGILELKYIRAV